MKQDESLLDAIYFGELSYIDVIEELEPEDEEMTIEGAELEKEIRTALEKVYDKDTAFKKVERLVYICSQIESNREATIFRRGARFGFKISHELNDD